jgi:hypothetical protein
MRLELPFAQYFRSILMQGFLLLSISFGSAFELSAQSQKPDLPDPIKFVNKFDTVANVVRAVFEDMDLKIELDDRRGGRITTRPYEFITGSLTSSEVQKVAIVNDTPTGNWLRAHYSAEAILEIVSPVETMVTIRARIEVLNRDVDGTEKWVPLDSLGTFERRILGRISVKLLGSEAPENKRKGFWGQSPQPVDPRQPRIPMPPSR